MKVSGLSGLYIQRKESSLFQATERNFTHSKILWPRGENGVNCKKISMITCDT